MVNSWLAVVGCTKHTPQLLHIYYLLQLLSATCHQLSVPRVRRSIFRTRWTNSLEFAAGSSVGSNFSGSVAVLFATT